MAEGGAKRGRDAAETMVGFVRALRQSGVPADAGRAHALFAAIDRLDATDPRSVYWAGRLTLCANPLDLARFDACFAYYFSAELPTPAGQPPLTVTRPSAWPSQNGAESGEPESEKISTASELEVLRNRDISRLSPGERAEVWRLLELMATRRVLRTTRRTAPARRGRLDYGRTIRATLRHAGEPVRLYWRDRSTRPRRVVLLVDVSGSMSPYADALLRLAHAVARGHPGHTEVFSVGTRLTRLTRELLARDAEAALGAAGTAIPDWSGGTRLGTELKEFLDVYGQRGMARGALVVIASDGWERGDPSLLGAQMGRLSRLAYRTVWANPHKAQPGYEPLTGGMRAALPFVDEFVSGHSLAALEELAMTIIGGNRA